MTDETELSIRRRNAAIGGLWSIIDAMSAKLPAARTTDPETSHKAAAANLPRRGTQASIILSHYAGADLTDEEAAVRADIPGGWKRCSDLRRLGLIVSTGRTRKTSGGVEAMVCELTTKGRKLLDSFDRERLESYEGEDGG